MNTIASACATVQQEMRERCRHLPCRKRLPTLLTLARSLGAQQRAKAEDPTRGTEARLFGAWSSKEARPAPRTASSVKLSAAAGYDGLLDCAQQSCPLSGDDQMMRWLIDFALAELHHTTANSQTPTARGHGEAAARQAVVSFSPRAWYGGVWARGLNPQARARDSIQARHKPLRHRLHHPEQAAVVAVKCWRGG